MRKKAISSIIFVIIGTVLLAGCGSSNNSYESGAVQSDIDKEIEETQKQIDELKKELEATKEETPEEPEEINDDKIEEKTQITGDFPYGIDKLSYIINAMGHSIGIDGEFKKGKGWEVVNIALCSTFNGNNGRGQYETDYNTFKVPSADVKDFLSVIYPDFNGAIPETTNDGSAPKYDEATDTYSFVIGELGSEIPYFYGYRKTGDDIYEALCGSTYEDSETGKQVNMTKFGLLTLVHNKYSDTENDPLFVWSIGDIKVIDEEEFNKLLPEFSKPDLLPVAEAYAKFLIDYNTDDYVEDSIHYACGFVDEDEIPELFIAANNMHNGTIRVFTYTDGGVKEIGDFGSLGEGRYIPYKNILIDNYWGSGADYTTFLKIDNGSLEPFGYVETEPEDITNYDPDHLKYMIGTKDSSNTVEVSKEEYEKKYRECTDGNPAAAISVSYDCGTYWFSGSYDDILNKLKYGLHIN